MKYPHITLKEKTFIQEYVNSSDAVESARTAGYSDRSMLSLRAEPLQIGHVVLFVADLTKVESFYTERLGFHVSDRYPKHGTFLRCSVRGGHHNLFLLKSPNGQPRLNHVAFTVRDLHEVFGGGLHISRKGWKTQVGPGRHPSSSAYFWYVHSPCGGLAEYYADEDYLTEKWKSRSFERKPELYAEWAVTGGLDGKTRRQNKKE